MKSAKLTSSFDSYSEQDTADKLILPYFAATHGFPTPDSLDYQAQHTLETEPGKTGRYDGLYLSGGYKEVSARQIVTESELAVMTSAQRTEGIEIDDPTNDRFYVPLDKAGASDIDGGLLPLFWWPVEFYIDWSKLAVSEMKVHEGAVFRNP
jgi:hypothetical protein